MKKTIMICLAVLLFLGAASLTAYPLISNYVNDKYQSVVHSNYAKQMDEIEQTAIQKARTAAREYNDSLSPLRYNREAVEEASVDYNGLLDVTGSGIMGYVEIPMLNISLPIYHGTGETVLEEGVGHLIGSSLPIGGEGCHAILTGHSGVAGRKLFSDIDQLRMGDVFYLRVLDETLAYRITEINKVLPHETELLVPVSGEDLCTLVTCYPYGVNTHRLLVRGSRIPYSEASAIETEAKAEPVKSTWKKQYLIGLLIGGGTAVGLALVLLAAWFVRRTWRKRHESV